MENNRILRLIVPNKKTQSNKNKSNNFKTLLFDIERNDFCYGLNIKKIIEKSINFFSKEKASNIEKKLKAKLKKIFEMRNDLGKFKTWIQIKMNTKTKKMHVFIIELLAFKVGDSQKNFYKDIDFVINSYKKIKIMPSEENPDVKKQTMNLIKDNKIVVFVRILCDKKKYEITIDFL